MSKASPAERRTLYVSRPLLNGAEVVAWAKAQGFKQTLSPKDMHVTVAFSRAPVDWSAAGDQFDSLQASDIEERGVQPLGDKGGIVLRFNAPELEKRWQAFRDKGASWDWPDYRPHITLTYSGEGAPDLSKVTPFAGILKFGPEKFAEVDDNWTDKIKERPAKDALAIDRATVRRYDADGKLHVAKTPISKANICPYYGREIPDYQALGLSPTKTYMLFRDPQELAKSAPSFNNVQLMIKHVPVNADDHQPDKTVGSTGTDAEFEAPYLYNSLVVWAREAIDGIEAKTQKELSSSYRYRADMTPGEYQGVRYDGVMRDIVANHVALVKEGRAGSDVLVEDSAPPTFERMMDMTVKPVVLSRKAALVQGALLATLQPMLAADAKIDLTPMLKGVTGKNFSKKLPKLGDDLRKATKGKLAADMDIEDAIPILEALADVVPEEEEEAAATDLETDPNSAIPAGSEADKAKAYLLAHMTPEQVAEYEALKGGAADEDPDETPEEKAKRMKALAEKKAADKVCADKKARDEAEAEKKKVPEVTKSAMDAAIKTATDKTKADVIATQKAIREAERDVRPRVGELDVAFDSAEDVYAAALGAMNVDIDGVEPSAYRSLFKAIPVADKRRDTVTHANDAAGAKSFATRFPQAERIGIAN